MRINKPIIILFILGLIVSFVIGVSYAYFTPNVVGNDTASTNLTTSATLRLNYNGTDKINMLNIEPGQFDSSTFTVKNTGNVTIISYDVNFSYVVNSLVDTSEVVYELDCVASDASTCSGKTETIFPSESSLIVTQGSIDPGVTHTYTLTITFIETSTEQDYNQGKEVSYKVTIDDLLDYSTLVARQDWNSTELFWGYAGSITKVTFEDTINVPLGAYASWDVSLASNGSIMAYIIDDGLGTSTYELFIQSNDRMYANTSLTYFFEDFSVLTEIINFNFLITNKVISMEELFMGCYDLTFVDMSSFYTTSATNMRNMFTNCRSITSWNLITFDTSNVTTMENMFYDNTVLTNVYLEGFDTSNVLNMKSMFSYCEALIILNLSTFDTSSVTDMSSMFSYCDSLTNLIIKIADFTTVTTYTSMFSNITSGINILVKDATAQTWITARLTDASKTGIVTIA